MALRDDAHITKGSISRMAFLAGCSKLTDDAKMYARGLFKGKVFEIIHKALIFMQHARRKTLSYQDFEGAIANCKLKIYTSKDMEYKSCRSIDKLRKNAGQDCIVVTKSAVAALIHQACVEYDERDARVSSSFRRNLQYYVEQLVIGKLRAACVLARHIGGRKTLQKKDLLVVVDMDCGDSHHLHPGLSPSEVEKRSNKGFKLFKGDKLPYKKPKRRAPKAEKPKARRSPSKAKK